MTCLLLGNVHNFGTSRAESELHKRSPIKNLREIFCLSLIFQFPKFAAF